MNATEEIVAREFLDVDPATLRLPPTRFGGADPAKFARQLSRFGATIVGMPVIEVSRGKDGELMIMNGAIRATRVAKFLPGQFVRVEVTDNEPYRDMSKYPTIRDRLP